MTVCLFFICLAAAVIVDGTGQCKGITFSSLFVSQMAPGLCAAGHKRGSCGFGCFNPILHSSIGDFNRNLQDSIRISFYMSSSFELELEMAWQRGQSEQWQPKREERSSRDPWRPHFTTWWRHRSPPDMRKPLLHVVNQWRGTTLSGKEEKSHQTQIQISNTKPDS